MRKLKETTGQHRISVELVLLAMFCGAGTAAYSQAPPPDPLSQYLDQVGEGLKNCGRVPIDGSGRAVVDDCVLDALGSEMPFSARYDKLSDDSDFAYGLVFSRSHRLVVLEYDSWACDEVKCVRVNSCDSPKVEKRGDELHIRCTNEFEM